MTHFHPCVGQISCGPWTEVFDYNHSNYGNVNIYLSYSYEMYPYDVRRWSHPVPRSTALSMA